MTARIDGTVLEHLMFHQSLVDDEQDNENIHRYLGILEREEGESLCDPVDEAIRSAFDLVLNHGMDPWSIDLLEFTRLYSARMGEERLDLIVAGKLVHMAWRILRLQSEEVVSEKERHDRPFMEWDVEAMSEALFEEGEGLMPAPAVLTPALRRRELRPVSLMELLDAFEDARREMERQRQREARPRKEVKRFSNQAHDEDMEKDVEEVWQRVQRLGAGPISVRDLMGPDHDRNISTFVALLFLVRNGLLAAWQDDLPRGEAFVEIKVDWMEGSVEDAVLSEADDKLVM